LRLDALEVVDAVAHVADAGDAAGDVEETIEGAEVDVHVVEAGEEGLAAAVDVLGVCGDLDGCGWAGLGDPGAIDEDGLVGEGGGVFGVEEVDVFDGDGMAGMC
jgi:hypothetical protein